MNKHIKKRGLAIQESIRRVLLENWDPIGICCDKNINHEYDSYIAGIYRLIEKKASVDEITNQLKKSEIQILGEIKSSNKKLIFVAEKLLQLDVKM